MKSGRQYYSGIKMVLSRKYKQNILWKDMSWYSTNYDDIGNTADMQLQLLEEIGIV